MRIVLDTNVLLSGLMLPDSTPGRIVIAWRKRNFDLVVSEPMLEEITRVLAYPKIRKRLSWDDEHISRYIALLQFEAEVVSIAGIDAAVPADPNDNHLLATLIASKADWLITGDSDFDELCGQYPIIAPNEFVRRFL
ncbi:MAG: putative toxin-antitoxin system toxin component, PIN family [Nitrosomonadales bacterium]|nr:putative toxin-antitoxin system toxin component, PIN family [Nitrosomonadales bacterium]